MSHLHAAYRLAELCNQFLGGNVLLEVWMRFTAAEISLGEWNFRVILYKTKHELLKSNDANNTTLCTANALF